MISLGAFVEILDSDSLPSSNQANQEAAKQSLSQICKVVFKRLERQLYPTTTVAPDPEEGGTRDQPKRRGTGATWEDHIFLHCSYYTHMACYLSVLRSSFPLTMAGS